MMAIVNFYLIAHTLCCTIETTARELKGQTSKKSAEVLKYVVYFQ